MQAGQAADAVRQKPQWEQQAHHPFPGVRIDEQHHARHHAQCARDQGNDRAEACEALHTDVEQDIRDAHRHSDDAVHDDKSRQRTIRLRKGVAAKPQQQDSPQCIPSIRIQNVVSLCFALLSQNAHKFLTGDRFFFHRGTSPARPAFRGFPAGYSSLSDAAP